VIENKPGASGMPAADQVAKATPDGHTLLATGPASIVVVPHLFPKLPYNPQTDLVPVTMLGAGAFVLVAHPSLGINSVQELIALARAKPGSIAYASGGNGSSGHLGTELFCQQTGIQMTHVPYKGDGAALPDLLSGQVQVMFTAPNVPMAQVKAGRLKLLAVTTRERVSSMPDTPSVHEAGVKDFEYLGWICIFAPARTPQAVIDQLHAAWNKARQVPAVRDKLEGLAMYAPERYSSREALQAFLRAEGARLGKVIRDANVKAEG
jgi:tripartite-type tricarboxylate transporter receptor subunit TctC